MEIVRQFDSFFLDEVEGAERELNIKLHPNTKLYLLNLLKELSSNEDFLHTDIIGDRPLSIVMLEALHKSLFERLRNLKIVGDLALIFSGLFPEYRTRRLVDIGYFMDIGKRSYFMLSDIYSQYKSKQALFILYSQLVTDFKCLIDILTEISHDLRFVNDRDMEKAIDRWRSTGVPYYKKALSKENIAVIPTM